MSQATVCATIHYFLESGSVLTINSAQEKLTRNTSASSEVGPADLLDYVSNVIFMYRTDQLGPSDPTLTSQSLLFLWSIWLLWCLLGWVLFNFQSIICDKYYISILEPREEVTLSLVLDTNSTLFFNLKFPVMPIWPQDKVSHPQGSALLSTSS